MAYSVSLELWNRYLSVNLTGVFLCYRAAARQMLKQGHGGRIIGESIFQERHLRYLMSLKT
jgi:NAD(P)-dependent dehydrogenase (short-subunit alcohol dehydrogenase family)